MNEIKKCSTCGNTQATGDYCARCGSKMNRLKVRTNMESKLFISTSLLMFLGWMIIFAGCYAGYRAYTEASQFIPNDAGLESGSPGGFAVVGNVGYAEQGRQIAAVIIFLSVAFGSVLIGLGKTLSVVGELYDKVEDLENGKMQS